ncbi:YetF domain-containing protein [Porcipelethomonas sp.]|uniref:YetF domain-containing protein n=1 Tax=Porcipelethomonas sp. TaxID=2981675 RepID=UPI003EF6A37E
MEILKLILTSLLSAAALFIIAKIMGHKQIAQLDFFDYISGITIGSIAAELATELEKPWKPLIAMIIYGAIAFILSIMTNKLPKIRKYVNGSPTIIMNDGKLYRNNMKKAKLDLSEFMVMCRQAGYFNLNDIQTAVFEYNGKLTILPVSSKRPVNPADMNLNPQPEYISTEVIMDGRILDENLKRLGLDLKWLQKQLEIQGYHNAKEIYLGVCDSSNNLSLFKGE